MSAFQDCGGRPFGQHLLTPFPADTPAFPWCNHQEVNAFLGQVGEGQGERTPKSGGRQGRERGHSHSEGQASRKQRDFWDFFSYLLLNCSRCNLVFMPKPHAQKTHRIIGTR